MKVKDFVAIEKALLPALPGFAIKGPLLFSTPVRDLLRGLYFDGSGFDKTVFFVGVFVMPLCVPTSHLHFTFGTRLRYEGRERWSSEAADLNARLTFALQDQAVPFLDRVQSFKGFTEHARSLSQRNLHVLHALAYSLIRCREFNQAASVLDQLQAIITPSVSWEKAIGEETKKLHQLLAADPEAAEDQLARWENETIQKLGLTDFQTQSSRPSI